MGGVSLFRGVASLTIVSTGVRTLLEWELFAQSRRGFRFCLYFDYISCMFFCFVSIISRRIIFYIGRYMYGDENIDRFSYLVFSFVARIFFLVFRLNMVRILLG